MPGSRYAHMQVSGDIRQNRHHDELGYAERERSESQRDKTLFHKRAPTRHAGHDAPASLPLLRKQKAEAARESLAIPKQERTFAAAYGTEGMRPDTRASARMRTVSVT